MGPCCTWDWIKLTLNVIATFAAVVGALALWHISQSALLSS